MLGQDLQVLFEKTQKGFAYSLLALEIQIEEQQNPKIESITTLIQMYMSAVEALESKSDKRYRYFNNKIQNLMKKKNIVQQLHLASTGRSADKSAMEQVFKAEISDRKNDLDLQIFLNQDQFDAKRIREMMKNSESKLKSFENKVISNLKKQDMALEERRKIRKFKSENGSVSKFDLENNKGAVPQKGFKTEKELDEYFQIGSPRRRKRSGSIQKLQNQIKSSNAKLKALLV